MMRDDFEGLPTPRRGAAGHVLLAGVAGACALGIGLGLWARPAPDERGMAVPAAPAEAPKAAARRLEIVVDERPAPIAAPIEVLPAAAPAPAPPPPIPTPKSIPAPGPAAPRLVVAKAAPASPKPSPRVVLAQAARAHADAAKAAKAAAHRIELAKAAGEKRLRLARAEARVRALAKARARTEALAAARTDARHRMHLASLSRPPPHAVRRKAPAVQTARLERKARPKGGREPKVERAALRLRKAPRPVQPPYRVRPAPPAPLPHAGLMRVSTRPACAGRDPGAAPVCADRNLAAAERQLARAYQAARAAGVPDAQLQRQQQRWLASRAAAAREAPWAVHDVYLARIAELNGMARDARRSGY